MCEEEEGGKRKEMEHATYMNCDFQVVDTRLYYLDLKDNLEQTNRGNRGLS
jgi:hypothetical protein